METLTKKFVEECKLAISEMLLADSEADFCEETYSKFRSIFLMFDMVKLITQENPFPPALLNKMKAALEEKLSGKK